MFHRAPHQSHWSGLECASTTSPDGTSNVEVWCQSSPCSAASEAGCGRQSGHAAGTSGSPLRSNNDVASHAMETKPTVSGTSPAGRSSVTDPDPPHWSQWGSGLRRSSSGRRDHGNNLQMQLLPVRTRTSDSPSEEDFRRNRRRSRSRGAPRLLSSARARLTVASLTCSVFV